MKLFGFDVSFTKTMHSVGSAAAGFLDIVREPFAGAWQRNIIAESRQNLLAFPTLYGCVAMIAEDIAKLRIRLMQEDDNGIWSEVTRESIYWKVLRKPNRFQNRIQFFTQWLMSKLLHGNAYIYLDRTLDDRRIVTEMYVLDPRYVTPLVADDGSIFYQLNQDYLNNVEQAITVPARDIIHDRCVALFHPLVGISPIYAAASSATQGIRIQHNSETFFRNMSRPSGVLTAPGPIKDETAARMKRDYEANFSGGNLGRLLVAGDGLKYEALTIPAADAQLVEQLRWTGEDVLRPFRMPGYKFGFGPVPATSMAALNQEYYNQCLQALAESIEICLDEGLGLVDVPAKTYGTEFDLDGLLRMDPVSRADVHEKLGRAAIQAPNEGRKRENLKPVVGGDSPMIQQQNYSLAAIAKRDAQPDPFASKTPAAAVPAPVAANQDEATETAAKAFYEHLMKGIESLPELSDA